MGGGFGQNVRGGDVVLADKSAKFRLPETSLGLPHRSPISRSTGRPPTKSVDLP